MGVSRFVLLLYQPLAVATIYCFLDIHRNITGLYLVGVSLTHRSLKGIVQTLRTCNFFVCFIVTI
jgi:hypothetical protein